MAKVNEKEIFEIKPWLNDTPQNNECLQKMLNTVPDLPDIPINPVGGGNIDQPNPAVI